MFRLLKLIIMLALLPIPVARSMVVDVTPVVIPLGWEQAMNRGFGDGGLAPVREEGGLPLQVAANKPGKCVPVGPPVKPPSPPPAVPPPKQSCTK